jgi:phage tail sheath gpL-like
VSCRADPAQPLQTVTLATVLAPPIQSRFQLTDRNTLLYTGVSTFSVADDGTVALENLITTYQKNSFGQPDDSYLEVETMNNLTFVLRQLKSVVTSKYSRVKLAANGTRLTAGNNVVTPNTIRADLIAQYQTLEEAGYVQGSAQFAQGLIVEQNAQNPNRVDVLYPAVLIDQLRIFALLMQFSNEVAPA